MTWREVLGRCEDDGSVTWTALVPSGVTTIAERHRITPEGRSILVRMTLAVARPRPWKAAHARRYRRGRRKFAPWQR